MEIYFSDLKKAVQKDIAESLGYTIEGFSLKNNLDFKPIAVTHNDII